MCLKGLWAMGHWVTRLLRSSWQGEENYTLAIQCTFMSKLWTLQPRLREGHCRIQRGQAKHFGA